MEEKEQRSREGRRKVTDRRKSNILNYEKPDSRSEPNRRSGRDRRIKSVK